MKPTIKIGTRGSKLALWQANYVANLLNAANIPTNIVIIETKGDKILDRSLAKVGSKGLFTEELETQLLEGKIDIAVHSAKDLPSDLGEKFKIIAFTEREQVNDVIISEDTHLLDKKNPVLGTSSVRRTALLKKYMPHVNVVNIRGNLQTRIRKMREGQCDGLVLAYAGVHRMEYDDMIVEHLSIEKYIPPVGQGSVAIETAHHISKEAEEVLLEVVNHAKTAACLQAERAFLKKLEGGCSIPAFAHASLKEDQLYLKGGIISIDGNKMVLQEKQDKIEAAVQLGTHLAEAVLQNGGAEILSEIRSNS